MTTTSPWKTATLAPLIDLINGFAFPSNKFTEDEGMPLIRIRDLDRQETEIHFSGQYDDRYIIKRGDLLIGMDGDFLIVKWKGNDALLNQRVCKLVAKDSNRLDQDFLFYRVIDEIVHINQVTSATTVKHLSSKDVLGIEIDLPPKPEQTKIAEILSTVDLAIEQTEALIAKQQRIKIGLMQDLLARGIDEHGNLRSEQTHQFKDSPLGQVPKSWCVKSLGDALHESKGFLQTGPFGSQLHAYEYAREGVPVIMPQDILGGQVLETMIVRIPKRRAEDLHKHRVEVNDIVFSRRGDLSRAAAIGVHEDGWLCGTGCFLLRVPSNAMNEHWLVDSYRHHLTQRQIETNAVGSTMPSLNNAVMEQIIIAFPSLEEQQEITRRRNSVDRTIHAGRNNLLKLHSLKTALMQDLLTGKKRVTPLLTGLQEGGV